MAAFGLIPVGLGIVFAAIGWFVGGNPHRGWVKTTGRSLGAFRMGLQPSYRYIDADGVEHPGWKWFDGWPQPEGAPVLVIYDPRKPSRSRMDSFVQKGYLFLVLGGMILVIGIFVTVLLAVLQSQGAFS